jgi:ribonuclease E
MDAVSAETPNTAAESAEVQAPAQGERRERRGRDRYGRERRERQTEGRNESTDTVSQEAPVQTAEASEGAPRSSYFDAFAAPAAAPATAAADAPAAVSSAEASAPVTSAASAAPSESRSLPKVASYTLPTEELLAVASQSGLQWVNSDADKVAAVQAAIAAEPKPIHVPRERAPVVVLDEGPLVLVETRKDLSEMKLPF